MYLLYWNSSASTAYTTRSDEGFEWRSIFVLLCLTGTVTIRTSFNFDFNRHCFGHDNLPGCINGQEEDEVIETSCFTTA